MRLKVSCFCSETPILTKVTSLTCCGIIGLVYTIFRTFLQEVVKPSWLSLSDITTRKCNFTYGIPTMSNRVSIACVSSKNSAIRNKRTTQLIQTFPHRKFSMILLIVSNVFFLSSANKDITYVIEPFESISNEWFSRVYNEGGRLNLTLSGTEINAHLFGENALRVEYEVMQTETWGGFVDFGWILNSTEPPHNCIGATHLSLWFKILKRQSLKDRVHLRLIMLDDSDCEGADCDNPPGQSLENYYSFHYVLDSDNKEWKELRINLNGDDDSNSPFFRTGWTGQVGNNKLDPGHIRGWRIELSIDSQAGLGSTSNGIILVDQLSCIGGGELFGAAFHIEKSFENALREGYWFDRYYQSVLSANRSTVQLVDGMLRLNYTIEQTETWGGFIDYQHLAPGNAYYNLSQAADISLLYDVENIASVTGRAHLRIILMDSSNCYFECSSYPGQNLENYYSFFYILDDTSFGNITVRLDGNSDSSSPFWRPGWTGIVGNNILDPSLIKGYRLELNLDSQGDIGSIISGIVSLGDLIATPKVDVTENDDGILVPTDDVDHNVECVNDADLFLDIRGDLEVKRVEFFGSKCCETCAEDSNCLYALATETDCFMGSFLVPDSVKLFSSDDSQSTVNSFWMDDSTKRGDFCNICECFEIDRSIDCRGKDLVIVPKTFTPESSWTPRVLDLRDNPRLVILGSGSLTSISETLEEIRLPMNLRHLSERSVQNLPYLSVVVFEGIRAEQTEALNFPTILRGSSQSQLMNDEINNVITSQYGFFSDVCCGLGTHIDLLSPQDGLTFCDMNVDVPGIDAVYEPFVEYFEAERLTSLRPSSPFMSEAAESPEKCAEYCAINDECFFFSYDARWKESEHTCALLTSNGTEQTTVCCHPDDYADIEGTQPGWTSGRPPRTRRDLDNARVLSAPQELVVSTMNGFKAHYVLSLGSPPLRGSVWIEPKLASNTNFEVLIHPKKVVLYDDKLPVTITVEVMNTEAITDGETIVVTNEINSCDTAFMISDALEKDSTVFIDVIAPKKTIIVPLTVVPLVATAMFIGVFFYISQKRRKADLVWNVDLDELSFEDPPEIVGRGTFGLVLLGEYRGTQVAVKRVIPPRIGHKQEFANFKMSLFGRGERQSNGATSTSTWGSLSSQFSSGDNQIDEEAATNSRIEDSQNPGIKSGFQSGFQSRLGTLRWRRSAGIRKRWSDEYSRLKLDFIKEMRILSKLRHPCITTVMGAVVNRKHEPMLVMEYMNLGSLYDVLHNETMVIDGEQILPILLDITSGVRFLHAAKPQVIHGDLKAQNILVDSKFRAKVADFGLTMKKQIGATGTPYWMAPELLRGESMNTSQSDAYSMGIILYEIFSRKDPYEGEDYEEVLKLVVDTSINKRPLVPGSCPPEIQSLMDACLSGHPNERPTFETLDHQLKKMDVANVEPGSKIFSMQEKKDKYQLERTSELLFEVFPRHIAEALRDGHKVEPESREVVTIFFSDIVGFTNISASLSPMKISNMLDRLYSKFDNLSHQYDVFKVETIGDAYMAVTNLIKDQKDHAKRIAEFSVDAIKAANSTLIDFDNPGMGCVNIRIGFHSGPVVANVVGSRNPRYCLFGDTVNTASRMESNSLENRIHCSARAAKILHETFPSMSLRSRGMISVKGKGEMHTFWVNED